MNWPNEHSPLIVLICKEIRFTARRPIYWISSIGVITFTVWLSVSTGANAIKEITVVSPQLARYMVNLFPQMILLLYPFSTFLMISLYLFMEMFTLEKVQKRLELLLITPLRANQIWLGKCLAIFALVYPFVLVTDFAYVGLWGYVCYEMTGVLPSLVMPALVVGLIGGPLLAFALISFFGLITLLISRSDIAQTTAFFTSFGVTFGGSYALGWIGRHMAPGTNLVTWPTAISILVMVALSFSVLWILQDRLDKDQIVRTIG